MELEQQPPAKLRDYLETIGITLKQGDVAGRIDLGENLNLNAAAIGLSLQNVNYDPYTFPALLYQPDNSDVTMILYEAGLVATVDAPSKDSVQDVSNTITDQLNELGLIEDASSSTITVPAETVPTPVIVDSDDGVSKSTDDQSVKEGTDQTTEETASKTDDANDTSNNKTRDQVRKEFEYTSDE